MHFKTMCGTVACFETQKEAWCVNLLEFLSRLQVNYIGRTKWTKGVKNYAYFEK
jgi:hypothetical protein